MSPIRAALPTVTRVSRPRDREDSRPDFSHQDGQPILLAFNRMHQMRERGDMKVVAPVSSSIASLDGAFPWSMRVVAFIRSAGVEPSEPVEQARPSGDVRPAA